MNLYVIDSLEFVDFEDAAKWQDKVIDEWVRGKIDCNLDGLLDRVTIRTETNTIKEK